MAWVPSGWLPEGWLPENYLPGGGSPAATDPNPLPIKKPQTRSVDAKTLADAFNKGQPTVADYSWPGGRTFFQKGPDAP